MRSRQGKTATHSEDDDKVGFVEVFPPMPLDAYLAQIYDDPGEFIR